MPVLLGERYPADFMGRPPHLAGRDLTLWTKLREKPPFRVMAWYFDVLCGTPAPMGPAGGTYPDEAWRFITSKRIDAVADLLDRWVLVELRRGASLSAIGTLQGYLLCWNKEPPDKRLTETLLVTDFLDPDARALAAAQGIPTLELGA